MAAVTVADRRRSVVSAVFCTLVVRGIPALKLQRHHRRNIPLPTSLQKTGQPGRMTVPTNAQTPRLSPEGCPREESGNSEGDTKGEKVLILDLHARCAGVFTLNISNDVLIL